MSLQSLQHPLNPSLHWEQLAMGIVNEEIAALHLPAPVDLQVWEVSHSLWSCGRQIKDLSRRFQTWLNLSKVSL